MERKLYPLKAIATGGMLLCLLVLSCFSVYLWYYRASLRPDNPPETFQENDLVGIWKADYRRYDWGRCGTDSTEAEQKRQARSLMEWLVLRDDKTFYQVLQDQGGQFPDQWAQGTWWVERLPDGVTRLHLEQGRFFAGDVCDFFPELSAGGGYYSADQTGHELLFGRGRAILLVGWDKFTKNLYLEYPFVGGDPDAPIIVKFERVPEAESVPVPPVKP